MQSPLHMRQVSVHGYWPNNSDIVSTLHRTITRTPCAPVTFPTARPEPSSPPIEEFPVPSRSKVQGERGGGGSNSDQRPQDETRPNQQCAPLPKPNTTNHNHNLHLAVAMSNEWRVHEARQEWRREQQRAVTLSFVTGQGQTTTTLYYTMGRGSETLFSPHVSMTKAWAMPHHRCTFKAQQVAIPVGATCRPLEDKK